MTDDSTPVPLSSELLLFLERVAARARSADRVIIIEDLILEALADPSAHRRLGSLVATTTLDAVLGGRQATQLPAPRNALTLLRTSSIVAFDAASAELLTAGARRVLTGAYEPRHLLAAIADIALAHAEQFTRFGLDSRAWRRALAG